MIWFANLKTGAKLILAFAIIILFLLMVVWTAYHGLKSLERCDAIAQILTATESNRNDQRAAILTAMALTNRSAQESSLQLARESSKENDSSYQRLHELSRSDSLLFPKIEQLTSARNAYIQVRDAQVIPLILDGKMDEARALSLGPQQDRFLRLRELGTNLIQDAQQKARQQSRQAVLSFAIAGSLAVVVAISLALFLGRLIAVPLKEISTTAERIAAGDLSGTITTLHREDEVG
ncbi:MAG: MCP four helix bundle domain-containing protein, partial [Verrucomicrobiota bacterium]